MFVLSVISHVYSNMPVDAQIFFRFSENKETPIKMVEHFHYKENDVYQTVKYNEIEYTCYKSLIRFSDEDELTEYWCTKNTSKYSFEKRYFYFKYFYFKEV